MKARRVSSLTLGALVALVFWACLLATHAHAASFQWPWNKKQEVPADHAVEVMTTRAEPAPSGDEGVPGIDFAGAPTVSRTSPDEASVAMDAAREAAATDAPMDAAMDAAADVAGADDAVRADDGPDWGMADVAETPPRVPLTPRASGATGRERINLFASDIAVQADGDLVVTERIRVTARGNEIKRGIVRDFPTLYRTQQGLTVRVGMAVESVRRDGRFEPFSESRIANGVRLRIGNPDVLLEAGEHEYVIRYRTTRQIGFFDSFDELYWNVTGSDWTFPIERATARITLPEAAAIQDTAIYTGPPGARGTAAREVARGPGQVEFQTTAQLGVGEGFTIAASWPKGIVQPPSLQQRVFYLVRDNLALGVTLLGGLLLAGYYLRAAIRFRRRTPRLTVPLFEPPKGMSAPAVRYFVRQRMGQEVFTVAILELIALRFMRMTRQPSEDVEFERLTGRAQTGNPDDPVLSVVLNKLFGTTDRFMRDEPGSSRLSDSEKVLEGELTRRWSPLFTEHKRVANRGTLWWFLYTALCAGAAWIASPANGGAVAVGLMFCIPGLAFLVMVFKSLTRRTTGIVMFCLSLLFCAPFLFGGLAVMVTHTQPFVTGALPGLVPMLMLVVVIYAYSFLKGYTEEGYRFKDEIDGFKQYLKIAEGPRLNALSTPEEKLEVFERYLPYAVALDVGKDWSNAFAKFFQGTAALALIDGMQRQYAGHDLLRDDPGRVTRAFAHDVTSHTEDSSYTTSSSSSAPGSSGSFSSRSSSSSSSGSSGSGSSGGGGGGGGGSGW